MNKRPGIRVIRVMQVMAALVLVFALAAVGTAGANISPKVIKVTPRDGVRTIGGINVTRQLTFGQTKARFGEPSKIRKPYPSICNLFYPSGLKLLTTSFGGSGKCADLFLQTASIHKKSWVMKVGSKNYRVGMPKSKLPKNAKFFAHYGYELATAPLFGQRSSSAFASLGGGNTITSLAVFVGGAGD